MTEESLQTNAGSKEPEPKKDPCQEKSKAEPSWDKSERRSGLASACHAVSYLSKLNRDGLRHSDRWTERLLVATLIIVAVLLFTPVEYLTVMIVSCDLLFGVILLVFIGNRFGSLNMLSPKQAALVWDLLISTSLFAIYLVVQLTALFLIIREFVGVWQS